jgi:hypothetical protein
MCCGSDERIYQKALLVDEKKKNIHKQQVDIISLLLFFQKMEIRLEKVELLH